MSDSITVSFIEIPRLPHLRLPRLMETYNDIHRSVFGAECPVTELKRILDASYLNCAAKYSNYSSNTKGIEDLALILFYGDFVKADTEQKREDFKNSLNRELIPKQFSIELPMDFRSIWAGNKP